MAPAALGKSLRCLTKFQDDPTARIKSITALSVQSKKCQNVFRNS